MLQKYLFLRPFLKVAVFVCLISVVPSQAATLFSSFEAGPPSGFPDAGVRYLADEVIDGWQHTWIPDANPWRTDFYTNGVGFDWTNAPHDGEHYIGWGAYGASGGTLSRSFATEIGMWYAVTYWLVAQEFATGSTIEQTARVEVLDESANSLAFVDNTFGPTSTWFLGQTLLFQATTNLSTLRFSDQSVAGLAPGEGTFNINWGLDSVTVEAIPEPATFAILGLGLSILAAVKKSRKAR